MQDKGQSIISTSFPILISYHPYSFSTSSISLHCEAGLRVHSLSPLKIPSLAQLAYCFSIMRPGNLTTPFKSSNLAIPPSPFSPKFPIISPTSSSQSSTILKPLLFSPTSAPPPEPLTWLWQCHMCRRSYPLGATRRCLDDGHTFCSSTTAVRGRGRNAKTTKPHRSCASEFDYRGWEAWGEWRREERAIYDACTRSALSPIQEIFPVAVAAAMASRGASRNCWANCDYPSECHWGTRPGRLQTKKTVNVDAYENLATVWRQQQQPRSEVAVPVALPPVVVPPPITFESILEGIKDLQHANCSKQTEGSSAPPKSDKEDFWSMLLSSARRRKSTASAGETPLVHSPLISNPMTVDNDAADASVNCEVPPPAPIFSWNNASRTSLEVKSFERISYDPLSPLRSGLPAAQLGPVGESYVERLRLSSMHHLARSKTV